MKKIIFGLFLALSLNAYATSAVAKTNSTVSASKNWGYLNKIPNVNPMLLAPISISDKTTAQGSQDFNLLLLDFQNAQDYISNEIAARLQQMKQSRDWSTTSRLTKEIADLMAQSARRMKNFKVKDPEIKRLVKYYQVIYDSSARLYYANAGLGDDINDPEFKQAYYAKADRLSDALKKAMLETQTALKKLANKY